MRNAQPSAGKKDLFRLGSPTCAVGISLGARGAPSVDCAASAVLAHRTASVPHLHAFCSKENQLTTCFLSSSEGTGSVMTNTE